MTINSFFGNKGWILVLIFLPLVFSYSKEYGIIEFTFSALWFPCSDLDPKNVSSHPFYIEMQWGSECRTNLVFE